MHEAPTSIFVLAMVMNVFLWAHLVLALVVRFAVRHDKRAVDAFFASESPRGLILHRSYFMQVKLFFPWISVHGTDRHSMTLRTLIWAARVAGLGLIIAFVLLIANFIYLASSGA